MDCDDPIAALPHRDPFLFVSRVGLLRERECGEGVWSVGGDEGFFAGHFPGEPIVPGVLLIEALAQLAGLVAATGRGSGGRLAHVNVRLHASVRPPAEIGLEARVERTMGRLWLFRVRACCGGIEVATGSLSLALGVPRDTEIAG